MIIRYNWASKNGAPSVLALLHLPNWHQKPFQLAPLNSMKYPMKFQFSKGTTLFNP